MRREEIEKRIEVLSLELRDLHQLEWSPEVEKRAEALQRRLRGLGEIRLKFFNETAIPKRTGLIY